MKNGDLNQKQISFKILVWIFGVLKLIKMEYKVVNGFVEVVGMILR